MATRVWNRKGIRTGLGIQAGAELDKKKQIAVVIEATKPTTLLLLYPFPPLPCLFYLPSFSFISLHPHVLD
jgi:hypothetical protein